MERTQYAKLADLEDRSWWFRLKREIAFSWLTDALPAVPLAGCRRIADVGCGTGGTLKHMPVEAYRIGVEYDREAALVAARRGGSQLIQGEAGAIPLDSCSCDAILMLDVLEHIEDDVAAIREVARVLAPHGVFVASVPAHPFLWSPHDVAFHHHRRYTARELREKLESCQLGIERLSYAFATAFPVACLVRPIKRLLASTGLVNQRSDDFGLLPGFLENTAYHASLWEKTWLQRRDLPVGISLFAIGRKPGATASRPDRESRPGPPR